MSEEKFTPGPWRVGISAASKYSMMNYYVFAERKFDPGHPFAPELFICRTDSTIVERDVDERRANAALIAAAPDMYGLLERMHTELRRVEFSNLSDASKCANMILNIETVLKKARGEE